MIGQHCFEPNGMFERVVSILEQARSNVVRTVNSEMVAAYWLIGRGIQAAMVGFGGGLCNGE